MASDISRVRFDPLRDFAGVVLQQGRLLLDADFNDLVAILERRLRAETSDLTSFGPDPDIQGVAWVPRQAVPAGTTCSTDDDDVPGWLDVVRPSDGRLTTHEVEIPPSDDPCELPPEGGYRGLENQTYRVEIHEGGQPGGAATCKWSRENAS